MPIPQHEVVEKAVDKSIIFFTLQKRSYVKAIIFIERVAKEINELYRIEEIDRRSGIDRRRQTVDLPELKPFEINPIPASA